MSDSSAQFGAVLQLHAQPGRRDDVVSLLRNYVNTLDGEPGTVLFAVAVDPADDDADLALGAVRRRRGRGRPFRP